MGAFGRSKTTSAAARFLAEFHAAVDHPVTPGELRLLRWKLHAEEAAELDKALWSWDRHAIARELADLVYVLYGTAHALEIDLDAALAEVHRANMTKVEAGVRRGDGKLLKPPDFVPPDMTEAVQ